MNGPMSMYRLKPLVYFQDHDIDSMSTMYKMKNICGSNFRATEVKEEVEEIQCLPNILEQEPISEVEILRKRQEGILTQLAYLKDQMLGLRDELTKKSTEPSLPSRNKLDGSYSQAIKRELHWDGVMDEIVVLASPEWPPYSLLAVNQLWPGVLRLNVSCHTHSSVSALPPHLAPFCSLADTPQSNLHIRLIWKQMGSDCEIIFSPLSNSPIRGEVNLLRYLHRTIAPECDLITEIKQDNLLDLCHQLRHVQTEQEKKSLVHLLSARLGKSTWLGSESVSFVDLAAWSALRSLNGFEPSENMIKWQSRCSVIAGVKAA